MRLLRWPLVAIGFAMVTAGLTWGIAHRVYMRQFELAQRQVFASAQAPLRANSTAISGIDRVANPLLPSYTFWKIRIALKSHGQTIMQRSIRAQFDLTDQPQGHPVDLRGKSVSVLYEVSRSLKGNEQRPNLIQLELYDMTGKVMRSHIQPTAFGKIDLTEKVLPLVFNPYTDVPIPLGYAETGFDLSQVRYIGIRFTADQFANVKNPNFYPANGTLTISPVIITPNLTIDNSIHLSLFSGPGKIHPLATTQSAFFVGINYPWRGYGWDFGRYPWSSDPNYGQGLHAQQKELARDFSDMALHGISVVRVFVFCDFRTGLIFESDRRPVSLDQFVLRDLETLFSSARTYNLKIIPVLYNFDMADGFAFDGTGERQELILDYDIRKLFLQKILPPALMLMEKNRDVIYAIDLMNEPEHALFLRSHPNFSRLKDFLLETAKAARTSAPNTPLTLGSGSRQLLANFWLDFPADILQFHTYQSLEDEQHVPYDYPARNISADKPVIIGEAEGNDIIGRITLAKKNGYAGILFWSYRAGDNFNVALKEIKKWHDAQKH